MIFARFGMGASDESGLNSAACSSMAWSQGLSKWISSGPVNLHFFIFMIATLAFLMVIAGVGSEMCSKLDIGALGIIHCKHQQSTRTG